MPKRPRASRSVESGEAGGGAGGGRGKDSGSRGAGTEQLQTLLTAVTAAPELPAHTCPEPPPGLLLHAVQCAFLRTACKPGQVTRWVRVSSCTPKVCGFDPRSGHRSRLQVRFLVAAHTVGNQCMFSLTAVSLPLFLPPPLPLE